MKRRILAVLLGLTLLAGTVPALAAEDVGIFTKDGPVWLGARQGSEALELVYSADKGGSWHPTAYGSAEDIQDIVYTGREYFIIGFMYQSAYTTDDPVNRAAATIVSQDWLEENASYFTSGLCSGEYQFLWTGTEYMMRQSIRGEPRGTHPSRGDSPRNKLVTILNEHYDMLSSVAFDGDVEAIRYQNGTYYATVGGVEHSFTRADWENSFEGPGIAAREFYSDGTVILQHEVNNLGIGRGRCSYDGVSWTQVPESEGVSFSVSVGGNSNPTFVPTGRGFFQISPQQRDCRATADGLHWFNVGEKSWLQESADYWSSQEGSRDLQFVWTGTEYMMRQNVALLGPDGYAGSPANAKVTFLDENYDLLRQYDFGGRVRDIGYRDGLCYAQVGTVELDSGLPALTVFASPDGENWEKTDLEAVPRDTDGGKKAPAEGDVRAGKYTLRLGDDKLLVSDDGVYFMELETAPPYRAAIPEPYSRIEAYPGRDGMVVRLTALSESLALLDQQERTYFNADIDAAVAAALSRGRYYVTLDGAYISFDDPPYEYGNTGRMMVPLRSVSEALGFSVEYDDRGVTCVKNGTTVTVAFGSREAVVNGERFTLDAGVELYHDRTYVPLRFFSEQMGLDVDWNGETGTAVLMTK